MVTPDSRVIQKIDNDRVEREGAGENNSQKFTPVLDIFTQIQLPKKQELMINLTGTAFDAKSYSLLQERSVDSPSVELFDEMWQYNDKISLIGDLEYTKKINTAHTLAIGNKYVYGNLRSRVKSSLTSGNYFTHTHSSNPYAELTGMVKSFMYRVTLGGNYYNQRNNDISYSNWTFTPVVLLGYKINKAMMLRALYRRRSVNPNFSELSPNKFFVSEGIVKAGNPLLQNSTNNELVLMYSVKKSWFEFEVVGGYAYRKNQINSFFVDDAEYIQLRYENAKYSKSLALEGLLSIMPFKSQLLVIKGSGGVDNQTVMSRYIGENTYLSYMASYEAIVNYKDFSLRYQGNVPTWSLNGPYLNLGEKQSNLSLSYKRNNFSASANVYWFFADASYRSKIVDASIVDYDYARTIKDNYLMFTLGLSWRFSTGVKSTEVQRSRNNSDSDAGLF